ncbi:MAG: hypothetical protein NVSMB9_12250 [Isosphaeraceae bacterium]
MRERHAEVVGSQENFARARSLDSSIRLVSLVVIGVSLLLIGRRIPVAILALALEGWVHGLGAWGPLVFGSVYVVAVVAMMPASVLTLVGAGLFGPVVAMIMVSLASTTGAALAFLIARHLARDLVAERVGRSPRFEAIDRAIGKEGWKIVALLRLSPAVPFNLQNYLYGLTRIKFWPCVLTSWVAMLPGTLLYVSLGYAGRAGLDAAIGGRTRSPAEWAFLGVGLVATVAVTVYVTRLARKALASVSPIDREESPPDPPRGRTRGTILLASIAGGALVVACYVQWRPHAIEAILSRFAPLAARPPGGLLEKP